MEKESVMWFMLNKLVRMNKIGGSHTEIKNITKGLPEQFTRNKNGMKIIREAIKELINKELVRVKPSTGEIHVSINPKKISEVSEFLNIYKQKKNNNQTCI